MTVDGSGQLLDVAVSAHAVRNFGVVHDVQLDPLAMRELDHVTPGEAIRDAITAAERASKAVRNEALDELRLEGRSVREIFEQGTDLSGLEAQIDRLRSP